MMIRTKQEIDKERQMIRQYLSYKIDESVEAEEYYRNEIKKLQKQLRDLNDEICYEDTAAGQMQMLEMEADEKIKQVLRELSQKTGHSYRATNELTELIDERSEVNDEDKA